MKELLKFLKQLEANNDREWFARNKSRFEEVEKEFKNLVFEVQDELSQIDHIATESTKTYRIYRDVRFSKDKTPFHLHRSVSFKRATAKLRGGYYLKVKNDESVVVGGFWGPSPEDMMHIRKQIQMDPSPLRKVLASKDVKQYFRGLTGEQVKSAPRGFPKDDPAIDLLKYKQLLMSKPFSNEEVISEEFPQMVLEGFSKMRPFFDYMSEILTTNLDGEEIEN